MRCRNSSPITSASADLDCIGAACEAIGGVHNASLPTFGVKKCDDELVVLVDEEETDARGLVNCNLTERSGRLSCGDSEGNTSLDEHAIDAAIAAMANAPPATTNSQGNQSLGGSSRKLNPNGRDSVSQGERESLRGVKCESL